MMNLLYVIDTRRTYVFSLAKNGGIRRFLKNGEEDVKGFSENFSLSSVHLLELSSLLKVRTVLPAPPAASRWTLVRTYIEKKREREIEILKSLLGSAAKRSHSL
jgi:hypothetical protein